MNRGLALAAKLFAISILLAAIALTTSTVSAAGSYYKTITITGSSKCISESTSTSTCSS